MKSKLLLPALFVAASLSSAVAVEKAQTPTPALQSEASAAPKKAEPTVAELEAQLKDARATMAGLRDKYLPRHPKMMELQRKITDLELQLVGRQGRAPSAK